MTWLNGEWYDKGVALPGWVYGVYGVLDPVVTIIFLTNNFDPFYAAVKLNRTVGLALEEEEDCA